MSVKTFITQQKVIVSVLPQNISIFEVAKFERVFSDTITFVDSLYIANSNDCWVVLFVDVLFIA